MHHRLRSAKLMQASLCARWHDNSFTLFYHDFCRDSAKYASIMAATLMSDGIRDVTITLTITITKTLTITKTYKTTVLK